MIYYFLLRTLRDVRSLYRTVCNTPSPNMLFGLLVLTIFVGLATYDSLAKEELGAFLFLGYVLWVLGLMVFRQIQQIRYSRPHMASTKSLRATLTDLMFNFDAATLWGNGTIYEVQRHNTGWHILEFAPEDIIKLYVNTGQALMCAARHWEIASMSPYTSHSVLAGYLSVDGDSQAGFEITHDSLVQRPIIFTVFPHTDPNRTDVTEITEKTAILRAGSEEIQHLESRLKHSERVLHGPENPDPFDLSP